MSISSFHPTRWTLVLRSRGQGEEAKTALSDLCAAYYGPVVAFLQREGRGEDDARDMAHAFFAFVLSHGVGTPSPERGRFRSYLLGALKHFLSKQKDAALAQKRGGGVEHVPLVTESDTSPGLPMPGLVDDTLAFDRAWAHTLIARSLIKLEQEHIRNLPLFHALKPWLSAGATASQNEIASALGISETAVKVAIHRLRTRFRELIRAEVAATVDDSTDVSGELQHLIAVASRG